MINNRLVFRLSTAAWVVCALGWLALLGAEAFLTSDVSCELAPGSSVYGHASWSWLPPGRTCTFDDVVPGHPPHVDAPSPLRLVVTALLVAWPLSVVGSRGASARREAVPAERR